MSHALRRLTAVALFLLLIGGAAAEPGLAEKYPAGSITTRGQAREALAAAQAAQRESDEALRRETAQCAGRFLQNPCTNDARRRQEARQRAIRDVEVRAREVLRRLDAEERAAQRGRAGAEAAARDRKREATDAAGEPARQDAAASAADRGRTAPGRGSRAEDDRAAKERAAAQSRERYRQRQQEHAQEQARNAQEDAARAGERAANVSAYEDKQRAAAAYARRKDEERLANEKRREQRRIERERRQRELEGQARQ